MPTRDEIDELREALDEHLRLGARLIALMKRSGASTADRAAVSNALLDLHGFLSRSIARLDEK